MGYRNSTDVFVIGGGPAGLATAIAAARLGMRVTVADSERPPIEKACGEGLMPDGLAALRELGVEPGQGDCFPFRGIRFLERGAAVDASFPNGTALGIRRTALHGIMAEYAAAAGVELRWQTTVDGLGRDSVRIGGGSVVCRWIVGADGGDSRVRRWAGLDSFARDSLRFGFRRHYRVAPWSDCMELYWDTGCQVYCTPVAPEEVCVAVISPDRRLRLDQALTRFPALARRLDGLPCGDAERGAISATRKLRRVWRGNLALVGDASGSVDAITGEGLCLAFRQSAALARCLVAGDLARYQAEHRRISRLPEFMADFMLLTAAHGRLRRRAMDALVSRPAVFRNMLAMHVGALSPLAFAGNALALGWSMLVA